MSLEDQYDAWVRGLMGGGRYAATPKQAEDANDAVQQMQAQLEALSAAQKRQSAASSALGAVQKAGTDWELLTLYYGSDITENEAQSAAAELEKLCPGAEVEVLEGAQPLYPLIITLE